MANSGISQPNARPDSAIISGFHVPVDAEGGIDLRRVKPGTVLEIQTKNTTYNVIPQPSGEMLFWGHPEFCPEPTLITGLGSTDDTRQFREGYLGPGLRLSFPSGGRRIGTSRIVAIQPKQKN